MRLYEGEFSGIYDKYGVAICEGNKVRGVFYQQMPVDAVCRFKNGAFGLEWNRGEFKDFHAFCQMCNVEYEVVK